MSIDQLEGLKFFRNCISASTPDRVERAAKRQRSDVRREESDGAIGKDNVGAAPMERVDLAVVGAIDRAGPGDGAVRVGAIDAEIGAGVGPTAFLLHGPDQLLPS